MQESCDTATYRIRVPVVFGAVCVQSSQGGCSGGSWQERPATHLVRGSGVARAVVVGEEGIQLASSVAFAIVSVPAAAAGETWTPTLGACGASWKGRRRPLLWWSVDHQREALLGSGELRDVVLGMGTADVLLHGAISLLLQHGVLFKFCMVVGGRARRDMGSGWREEDEQDLRPCSAFDTPSRHGCAADRRRHCSRLRRRRILSEARVAALRAASTLDGASEVEGKRGSCRVAWGELGGSLQPASARCWRDWVAAKCPKQSVAS